MIKRFDDREKASREVASGLAKALRRRLASGDGRVVLVVSGGSSPKRCLQLLSLEVLDWQRVTVTLTDERDVPNTHNDSNERMVRETLLQNEAAQAVFATLDDSLLELPRPFVCSLVGVGEDGHFASLFPDLDKLPELLDLNQPARVCRVKTVASPYPRHSMNLSLIAESDEVYLLAFGERKLEIIKQPPGFPVAALLNQKKTPVRVLWAP